MSSIKDLIKSVFGEQPSEVKFAEAELENGQVIEAESFEPGSSVFLRTEDGPIPLPEGEYLLKDGSMIVVAADGTIAEITPSAEAEEPAAEAAAVKEEMSEEKEFVTKEDFEAFKQEVLEGVSLMATQMSEQKKKVELSDGAKAELEQLKKSLHKKRNLNKEDEQDKNPPLPKTREVRNKFFDPHITRVRENNEKFITQ
jgi:hypothetical protein